MQRPDSFMFQCRIIVWLQVSVRTDFKIILITFEAHLDPAQSFVLDLLTFKEPVGYLCSSDDALLVFPMSRLKTKAVMPFAWPSHHASSLSLL